VSAYLTFLTVVSRYFPQHELFEFSSKNGILLMAHQPLGGRPVPVVRGHPEEPFPAADPTVPYLLPIFNLVFSDLHVFSCVEKNTVN